MILVDTSIWIDHLRRNNPTLSELLHNGQVMCHPFIIGELACGNLKNRDEIIPLLYSLTQAEMAEHDEILYFIQEKRLMGLGVGLIDIHLLASTILEGVKLWTLDKRLMGITNKLNIIHKTK